MNPILPADLRRLSDAIVNSHTIKDLRRLASGVTTVEDIDWVGSVRDVAHELVDHCRRRGLLPTLVDELLAVRSHLEHQLAPLRAKLHSEVLGEAVSPFPKGPAEVGALGLQLMDELLDSAAELLATRNWPEARAAFVTRRTQLEADPGRDGVEVRRRIERARMGEATARLVLGEKDAPRKLAKIRPSLLPQKLAAALAFNLAAVGRPDDARRALEHGRDDALADEVEWLLAARAGADPGPLPEGCSSALQVHAFQRDIEHGDLASAAERLEALWDAGPQDALQLAVELLVHHAWPTSAPAAMPIPHQARPRILRRVDALLRPQTPSDSDPYTSQLAALYFQIVDDQPAVERWHAWAPGEPAPPDTWQSRLYDLQTRADGGDLERAIDEVLTEVQLNPIHLAYRGVAVRLLLRAGRVAEAHRHARAAWERLPGAGQVRRLAELSIRLGHIDEAREALADRALDDVEAELLWASVAEPVRRSDSVERLTALAPDDARTWVVAAVARWQAGDPGGALAAARRVVTLQADAPDRDWLSAPTLAPLTAVLLDPSGDDRDDRIKVFEALIRDRHASTPAGQAVLLALAEERPELAPTGVDAAVRAGAGLWVRLDPSSVIGQDRGVPVQAAAVPAEMQRVLLGHPLSVSLERRLPPGPPDPPTRPVHQGDLLLGHLELYILAQCGLLDALHERGGRVHVPASSVGQIREELTKVQFMRVRHARVRTAELRRGLARLRVGPQGGAMELVRAVDGVLVGEAGPGSKDAAWLVRSLAGDLGRSALSPTGLEPLPPLERPVVVTAAAAVALGGLRLFEPVIDALVSSGFGWVDPRADRELEEHERLGDAVRRAYARSVDLARWVAARERDGTLMVCELREPDDVPPPRAGSDAAASSLRQLLAWSHTARALDLILVTADVAVGMAAASSVELLWPTFQWGSAEQVRAYPRRDVVPLARLAAELSDDGPRTRTRLVENGDVNAINSEVVLHLVDDHGGLMAARPARILADIERWHTRSSGQIGAVALLHLASTVGVSIALLCVRTAEPDAWAPHARELLRRMDALSDRLRADPLTLALRFAVEAPTHAASTLFREVAGAAVLDSEGAAGRVWASLREWAASSPRRLAAWRRATGWVARTRSDERSPADENLQLAAASVLLMIGDAPIDEVLEHEPHRSVALIEWETDPMSLVGARGASGSEGLAPLPLSRFFESGPDDTEHGSAHRLRLVRRVAEEGWDQIGVAVPAEASLLRRSGDAARAQAQQLAWVAGTRDGRLTAPLTAMVERPDDHAARRAVARAFLRSPWRTMEDDPSLLLQWLGYTAEHSITMEGLLELLAEPSDLEPGTAADVLQTRCEAGGAWHARADVDELVLMAAALPVPVVNAAPEGIHPRTGLRALRMGGDLFIGFVCRAVILLAARAAGEPTVALANGTTLDLRGELSEATRTLVASALALALPSAHAEPSSFADDDPTPTALGEVAAAEPAVMRLCLSLVLSKGGVVWPERQQLWLTWRLAQWWWSRWAAANAELREHALSRIRRFDVEPAGLEWTDRMDPRGWTRARWPTLRAAFILDAVGVGDLVTTKLHDQTPRLGFGGVDQLALLADHVRPPDMGERWPVATLGHATNLPRNLSECVLLTMTRANPVAYMTLGAEARVQWLQAALTGQTCGELRDALLTACASAPARLSPAEVSVLDRAWNEIRLPEHRAMVAAGLLRHASDPWRARWEDAASEVGPRAWAIATVQRLLSIVQVRPDDFEEELSRSWQSAPDKADLFRLLPILHDDAPPGALPAVRRALARLWGTAPGIHQDPQAIAAARSLGVEVD
ncbi:MAG: hypothetical protein ACI9K2_006407 [Myxococcota bacterium]